jgi:hypothetical protein
VIETSEKIEGRYVKLIKLLTMSKQFQVHETRNLTVKKNRDTGEKGVQVASKHKAPKGYPLEIPNIFMIAIQVFLGRASCGKLGRSCHRMLGGEARFTGRSSTLCKTLEIAFNRADKAETSETDLQTFVRIPET